MFLSSFCLQKKKLILVPHPLQEYFHFYGFFPQNILDDGILSLDALEKLANKYKDTTK